MSFSPPSLDCCFASLPFSFHSPNSDRCVTGFPCDRNRSSRLFRLLILDRIFLYLDLFFFLSLSLSQYNTQAVFAYWVPTQQKQSRRLPTTTPAPSRRDRPAHPPAAAPATNKGPSPPCPPFPLDPPPGFRRLPFRQCLRPPHGDYTRTKYRPSCPSSTWARRPWTIRAQSRLSIPK